MARDRNREGRRDEDDFLYEDNLRAMGKGEKETAYLFRNQGQSNALVAVYASGQEGAAYSLEAVSEERS